MGGGGVGGEGEKGGAFLHRDQSSPVYTHTRANYVFVIKYRSIRKSQAGMWESEIFTQAWPEAEALFLVFLPVPSHLFTCTCTRVKMMERPTLQSQEIQH